MQLNLICVLDQIHKKLERLFIFQEEENVSIFPCKRIISSIHEEQVTLGHFDPKIDSVSLDAINAESELLSRIRNKILGQSLNYEEALAGHSAAYTNAPL